MVSRWEERTPASHEEAAEGEATSAHPRAWDDEEKTREQAQKHMKLMGWKLGGLISLAILAVAIVRIALARYAA